MDGEVTVELWRPESEAEALGIEAELRAHGIEPVLARRAAGAYPGIAFAGGWGVVRVRAADEKRAKVLLEDWLAERGDGAIDEEELARAAMEADDTEPEEIARRRAALARTDGGAYRARGAREPGGGDEVAPGSGWPSGRTMLMLASIALALAAAFRLWLAG